MPKKITELPNASLPLTGTEKVELVQAGQNVQATAENVASAARPVNKTTFPSANDDSTQGYVVGSLWLRSDTRALYMACDVTPGAARWVKLDNADTFVQVANNWFTFEGFTNIITSAATLTAGRMTAVPFIVKQRTTVGKMSVYCELAEASKNFAFAIYPFSATLGRATGTPIVSSGVQSAGTTGSKDIDVTDFQIEPGVYMFMFVTDSSTAKFRSMNAAVGLFSRLVGAALSTDALGPTGSVAVGHYYSGQTVGTWPDLTATAPTGTLTTATGVVFAHQIVSVP